MYDVSYSIYTVRPHDRRTISNLVLLKRIKTNQLESREMFYDCLSKNKWAKKKEKEKEISISAKP